MKYLISIKYDGSKFHGFQRLQEYPTVQKKLEEALTIINKKEVTIKGAGRTDKGVHAKDAKASFDLDIKIDCNHLKMAINSLVEPYIYITKVEEKQNNFHARFSTKKKTYIYKINMDEYDPINYDYELQINRKLDIKRMKQVAKLFIGVHSFKNFVSGERQNYECIIYDIKFKKKKNHLEIRFTGQSFYKYMVRNLVGAMLDVEKKKNKIEEIKEALNNPEKKMQFTTALPNGLYLEKIEYGDGKND